MRSRGVSSAESSVHTVVNPATEEVIAEVELAGTGETDAAIARAAAAYESWRAVAPADRGRLLRAFAAAVDADRDKLAALEVANAGHTIGNARWEAGNVRDVLEYFSAAPERNFGRQIPVAGGIDITFKEPLGVVGVIVPWNFRCRSRAGAAHLGRASGAGRRVRARRRGRRVPRHGAVRARILVRAHGPGAGRP
jgi:acyl-CoA reductase-like NAD-dependent aldehyde dehydrogenase